MIVAMIIEGIIVTGMTVIIHQEMIEMTGGHTKVTDIMMIEGGMTITDMIIVDFMMTEEMIIDDPKDLDNFNIILRVEMMQNHNMFGRHSMKRENLVDQRCQIAIFAGKMVTMLINGQQRIKAKHWQLIWSLLKYTKLQPVVDKKTEWDIQEEVRKTAKEWMHEANNNNVAKTLQNSIVPIVTSNKSDSQPDHTITGTDAEDNEVWQALTDSKNSLSFSTLLKLVPHFTNKVAQIIAKNKSEEVVVNFMNPTQRPTIMDEQSPSIKVIIQGQEVPGSIVDGGSDVNVINKLTYDQLGKK